MKVKYLSFLAAVIILFCAGCRKNQEFKKETAQVSEDNAQIQAGLESASDDLNSIVSGNASFSGRYNDVLGSGDACGATVDTSQRADGVLEVTFIDTVLCKGYYRSGNVKITLLNYTTGTRWRDKDATLKLDFTELKVTRASDNKSVTFNGTSHIKNISGGNVPLLIIGAQAEVIHDHTTPSAMTAKFDDGATSTFNISRRLTHTFTNGVYQVKAEGTGSHNGLNGVESWGTTREGDAYTSQVLEPVIWNSTCGADSPISGKLEVKVDEKDFSLIADLGRSSTGDAVTSGCPWGLKVTWTYKNKSASKLISYR